MYTFRHLTSVKSKPTQMTTQRNGDLKESRTEIEPLEFPRRVKIFRNVCRGATTPRHEYA